MLKRLGRFCHDRRGLVVVAWVLALFVVGGAAGVVGSAFSSEFSLPDVESATGLDILEEHFGGQGAGFGGNIVFTTDRGVDDPEVAQAMDAFFADVATLEDITITSPYSEDGALQISPAGEIAYASVELPFDTSIEEAMERSSEIKEFAPGIDGVQIEYGGDMFVEFEPPQSEILGLAFAIVILIVAFGSVLAMGLPIGTALAGIGIGSGLVMFLSHVFVMPDFTNILGIMIGLGVGIDYALFIVTRYREGLRNGLSSGDATAVAIDTAGRAVVFAGITVVISLLGMILMGVSFTSGLGIGAATVVAATMVASVTLVPALLGFAGHRIEITRWRGLIAAGMVSLALLGVGIGVPVVSLVALPVAVLVLVVGLFLGPLKAQVPRRPEKPVEQTLPYRWSRLVQRRPWTAVITGLVLLALLAAPVLSLRLGFSDHGNYPEDTSTHKAYDLLAEGFGPGFNGPLLIAATVPADADPALLQAATAAISNTDGVDQAAGPIPNDPAAPTAVQWFVFPETSPQDEATTELVATLREDVLPGQFDGTGVETAITGQVAIGVDFSEYLAARMPLFFGVVLALSFLLLMTVFRSVLVPLKAVIVNLISIGAAYGVIIAIFQWGWGASLLGIGSGPIEPFIPMMMFAIVFGLSMDYEVFLLSRVKEEYDYDHDNARAVADGLASTARVISAAAAIMVFVFGSFLLEDDRIIKLFGVGLAAAIALDATIIRLLLVPATMELLGDRNWWIPRWLDRILPNLQVEGPSSVEDDTPDSGESGESGESTGEHEKVPAGV